MICTVSTKNTGHTPLPPPHPSEMASSLAKLLYFVLLCRSWAALAVDPKTDEIKDLPGAPGAFNFKQYSGYGLVNSTKGRYLFYWFVESQSSPSQDPLVLWLNGGPGCSSIGGGLMTENGPFQPNADHTLRKNNFSWNKVANVLYLESPSGVGFSYSKTVSDYIRCTDRQSALDIVAFLVKFLKAYPAYKSRPFYISGESYGGHYVPTTAQAIVQHNAMETKDVKINLQGMLVGNALTHAASDNAGNVQTWLGYNLIEMGTGAGILKYCNLSIHMIMYSVLFDKIQCVLTVLRANIEIGHIDVYNMYKPICSPRSFDPRFSILSALARLSGLLNMYAKSILAKMQKADPCLINHASSYLNIWSVREAIHAHHHPFFWTNCNYIIRMTYSLQDMRTSMLPVYKYLLKNGIRVHIYSGDLDTILPTHGTRNWIALLERNGDIKETRSWFPWTDSASQVGGYEVQYGPLFTFTTVRGAGHMVPTDQPLRALDLFTRFLKGA